MSRLSKVSRTAHLYRESSRDPEAYDWIIMCCRHHLCVAYGLPDLAVNRLKQ